MEALPNPIKNQILHKIDAVGALTGIGVVLNRDDFPEILRKPASEMCQAAGDYLVIDATTKPSLDPAKIAKEASLAAINCSAAVIAALVTFGSAATAPFSGGSSLALTSIGYAATAATFGSCIASAVRTYNEYDNPNQNSAWDNSPAYQTTMQVLDGVSLLGVGASAIATVRVMGILGKAGISLRSVQRNVLNRQERLRLTREIHRANRPHATHKELKALLRSKTLSRRMNPQVLSAGAVLTLRDSIAASLSFLSSALDGHVRNTTIYLVRGMD
ncbi:hypothetical protein [Endozoicomonas arenosclerae]|uniref:hypothetical protein n=1 Tax=Endozoicomonas arenosclerae TaxID=1633495 RepID=UPI0007863950|nr:hypothetical protein [Endozoicomonas arenosclerae]